MNNINSFVELEKAMDKADYDFQSISLNEENYTSLRKEILNFSDELLYNAERVLKKYYLTQVPKELLKKLLSQDILLGYEVYTNGISDTCQRSLLIDSVLEYLEMRAWPTNSEGEEEFSKFCREFKDKASHHSIIFPTEE